MRKLKLLMKIPVAGYSINHTALFLFYTFSLRRQFRRCSLEIVVCLCVALMLKRSFDYETCSRLHKVIADPSNRVIIVNNVWKRTVTVSSYSSECQLFVWYVNTSRMIRWISLHTRNCTLSRVRCHVSEVNRRMIEECREIKSKRKHIFSTLVERDRTQIDYYYDRLRGQVQSFNCSCIYQVQWYCEMSMVHRTQRTYNTFSFQFFIRPDPQIDRRRWQYLFCSVYRFVRLYFVSRMRSYQRTQLFTFFTLNATYSS